MMSLHYTNNVIMSLYYANEITLCYDVMTL